MIKGSGGSGSDSQKIELTEELNIQASPPKSTFLGIGSLGCLMATTCEERVVDGARDPLRALGPTEERRLPVSEPGPS